MTPLRRILLIALASILALLLLTSLHSTTTPQLPGTSRSSQPLTSLDLDTATLTTSHAIAPKLANETAKAELGRATWKYFHTLLARFPSTPTPDERAALKTYIHLFQRLYPCGECAEHFGQILEQYPPQVSSRKAASDWGCHVHNEVNRSLGKEVWDCAGIGGVYDCGCAEDEEGEDRGRGEGVGVSVDGEKEAMSQERVEAITGVNGRDMDVESVIKAGAGRILRKPKPGGG